MRTLSEIKDQTAQHIGYQDWKDYMTDIEGNFYERERVEKIWEEVCKRYAEEVLRLAANVAKTYKVGNGGSWYDAAVDKSSILNLINELK